MIGPLKALKLVTQNRTSIPAKEIKILAVLIIGLGILHTIIFYKTAGRVFPDDEIYRLILMAILVASVLLTVIYVRCLKWVKKFNLEQLPAH